MCVCVCVCVLSLLQAVILKPDCYQNDMTKFKDHPFIVYYPCPWGVQDKDHGVFAILGLMAGWGTSAPRAWMGLAEICGPRAHLGT